jgi:tetratricopeptide (TPR) repeat protein
LNTDKILKKAVNAHQEGKLEEAERLYHEILKVDPTQLDANNNIGVLLYKTNRLDESEKYYKKAIELKPDYAEAHNNLGNTFYALKKLDDAEKSYKKAIEHKKDYADAYNNLANILFALRKFNDAEKNYKKAIELNPDYVDAHFNLSNFFYTIKKYKQSVEGYRQTIACNPHHVSAYNNLGNALYALGKMKEANISFIKANELKPDYPEAHANYASSLYALGKFEEAAGSYKKAFELKPDYIDARYDFAVTQHTLKQYKKAADEFVLMNYKSSHSYLLKCWFELNDQSNFNNQLDKMLDKGIINPVVGSFVSRSKARYGIHKQNPFCNEPLDYVIKTDLTKLCDFKKIFIQTAKNTLNDDATFNRTQSLLINGTQTSGNLFSQKNDLVEKMKDIIDLEIKKYRENFKDSKEGFLKNWPQSYYLNGWLVSMKNGGKLSPHMHDYGWLSGSIYINVPPKKKADSGNLVVCIDDKESDKNSKKSIDVVTGSFCLFPASLLHYTIPFLSDEERIVLAFDVVPK